MPATEASCLWRVAPQFVTADVVRAAEHYRDVLGFSIQGYFGTPPTFAMLRRDGVEIHLGKSDVGEVPRNRAAWRVGVDAYVWVQRLDDLAAELRGRGARILEGPVLRVYGMREVLVEDLDGHVLAFGEAG